MELPKTAIVVAGVTGDLAQRKLIPAFETLFNQKMLGAAPLVIGTGRTPMNDAALRKKFSVGKEFAQCLHYHQNIPGIGHYIASMGTYERVIFFLALPPEAYVKSAVDIAGEGFGTRASIIIEKPFGYDIASSRQLSAELARYFNESQLFRIDHFLAKEAVQNILVFRFANSLFNPVWNSNYIESIQINALEEEGVVERGAYFDRAGIIRDMVQNHLLQLLCLLIMEAPPTLDADDIRCQKIQVLRALHIDECYRFQYDGYRKELHVNPDSSTDTYAELRLSINTIRWNGVPVFIRTGKSVGRKGTEIGVRFKKIPPLLFNQNGTLAPNQIIFKIQPSEGIILNIQSKVPGTDSTIIQSKMNFCYSTAFAAVIPEAYLRLLYDVLRNDHTLFVSARESEIAWSVVEPVLDKGQIISYKPGHLPQSRCSCDWIRFEDYQNICGHS